VDLLVNATPVGGRRDEPSPFSEEEIEGIEGVVDMVYGGQRSRLSELADAAGAAVIEGRDVLAHQGFAQFAAFTGQLPPKEAMRQVLDRF
jgi:shikimate 5-dehydrogenase